MVGTTMRFDFLLDHRERRRNLALKRGLASELSCKHNGHRQLWLSGDGPLPWLSLNKPSPGPATWNGLSWWAACLGCLTVRFRRTLKPSQFLASNAAFRNFE
jgi:hypothetical protein